MIRTYCDKCQKEGILKEISVYGDLHDFRIDRNFCKDCYKETTKKINEIMENKE